jgi:hypothetical protein
MLHITLSCEIGRRIARDLSAGASPSTKSYVKNRSIFVLSLLACTEYPFVTMPRYEHVKRD